MTDIPFKYYYRPDELADAADLSIWTIYRMIREDRIKHSYIGHSIRIPSVWINSKGMLRSCHRYQRRIASSNSSILFLLLSR